MAAGSRKSLADIVAELDDPAAKGQLVIFSLSQQALF